MKLYLKFPKFLSKIHGSITYGDRKVLEEVLFRDPRTRSEKQVKSVLDEIMALPFNSEMKRHYGG